MTQSERRSRRHRRLGHLRRVPASMGVAVFGLALAGSLILGATSASAVSGSNAMPEAPETVAGETILSFDDPADAERVLASAEGSDALDAELLADDLAGKTIIVVSSENASRAQSLIGAAEALPGVEAQPNYVYHLVDGPTEELDEAQVDAMGAEADASPLALPTLFPNDKHAGLQYALLDIGDGRSKSGANIFEAWDLVRSQPTHDRVSVAVLDTGFRLDHVDLQANVNRDLAYNVFTGDDELPDPLDHGTGVAGVIAATANNEIGVAGVAAIADDLVSVIPVKIFEDTDGTETSNIVKGLDYVDGLVEDGVVDDLKVLNLSLGVYYEDGRPTDSAMLDAVHHLAESHGILTVAAGGNGDENLQARTIPMYPSDEEGCLGVTALTETGANAEFSDYNLSKDISAPGVNIATTSSYSDASYAYDSGTSFSTPVTAGVVALMNSVYPDLTPAEAIEIVKATAAPLPDTSVNDWGDLTGSAGALDAGAAVREALRRAGKEVSTEGVPVYRLYNPYSTEHLYTTDRNEYDELGGLGWRREGVAWRSVDGGAPIYRLYNPFNGDHLYTTSEVEYERLGTSGWRREGVSMGGATEDDLPIYRLYNPWMTENAGAYSHLWTADPGEYEELSDAGWVQEGTAWYGLG